MLHVNPQCVCVQLRPSFILSVPAITAAPYEDRRLQAYSLQCLDDRIQCASIGYMPLCLPLIYFHCKNILHVSLYIIS